MEKRFIVTIGREFGSGGREVAIKLANLLDINFYDKKLIAEAARRSGLSDEYIEEAEEKVPGKLFYAFSMGFGMTSNNFSPESVFNIQSDTIREIASRESCVIVGRSADYILRENPYCINIFIHAPLEFRVEQVSKRENVSKKEAAELIRKIDKTRAAYYDFYTNKQWGASKSYHLSIDSSILGVDETAAFIKQYINIRLTK